MSVWVFVLGDGTALRRIRSQRWFPYTVRPFVRHQTRKSDLVNILGMIAIECMLDWKLNHWPCQQFNTLTNRGGEPLIQIQQVLLPVTATN